MKTLAERLIWARENKRWTQCKLARMVGCSQSTIGNLEAGIRLTSRRVAIIASYLEVSALWLETGKGHPQQKVDPTPEGVRQEFRPDPVTSEATGQLALVWVSNDEIELLTLYRRAKPSGQRLIRTSAYEAPKKIPTIEVVE